MTQAILKTTSVFTHISRHLLSTYMSKDIPSLKKKWALELLNKLNFEVTVKGNSASNGPLLLLGNHISYIDIPLLFSCNSQISFIAKEEVKKWPLIGAAATKLQTVFVNRNSPTSREDTKEKVSMALKNEKRIIAAFPSGTTCTNESKPWRYGLFQIAYEHQIPVQFFRIKYLPLRKVAYINEDTFLPHLYQLAQLKKLQVTIEFHEPVYIKNPALCSEKWQAWSRST